MISIVILSTILPSYCQSEKPFTKGHLLTGGSFSLSFARVKDFKPGINPLPDVTYSTKRNSIESGLSLGYFLYDQFVFGLRCEFLSSKEITTSSLQQGTEWEVSNSDILIGPVIRYYTNTGIFLEGSASISFLKEFFNGSDAKWTNYSWSTGIGYSILINQSIAIEPVIKYRFLNTEVQEIDKHEKSGEISISICFQIYLNTKRME
jgi:hypothetical protein